MPCATRAPCHFFDDEQRQRAARAGHDDARDVDARFTREQHEVRLVFDLRAAARQHRGRRVAIGEVAPGAREELSVGFVAPERDDAHGTATVVAVADEDRSAHRLLAGEVQAGDGHTDPDQRLLDLAERGAADRGAEDPFDQVGDAPAEHDGGDEVGGEAARQVEAGQGEQRDQALPEAPGRSREVR